MDGTIAVEGDDAYGWLISPDSPLETGRFDGVYKHTPTFHSAASVRAISPRSRPLTRSVSVAPRASACAVR